ncbi:MAG: hypothetical protein A2868_01500 [Candidatus Levybacteria bacterium RIFCSPHIGHO2_01_FULL_40_15b]|nr:MAG: hypothetical protein A2868_01500 [Candidatus Levybacteria bacterium RIFCSPHIGHO2_01_FULL_40_15b]
MKKNIATLIDELSVTNIKIYHLMDKIQKDKHTREDTKKVRELNKYLAELHSALNKSKAMKKSVSTLIDELSVTNIKIYHLVEKIQKNKHTREDAKKAQDLNRFRSELCNAINRELKERENIRI